VTKHTAMAWNTRRVLIEVVDGTIDDAEAAARRLQGELRHKSGDERWQCWEGAAAVDVRRAGETAIDMDVVRDIAGTSDAGLDAMDYMDPSDVRDLCREILRLRGES
jgi:hypothetical protein